MRNSWTRTFRRLAAATVVAGTTMYSSAMCYAQMASDSATDPAYADGWQDGDNGGTGFTAWNFDSGYIFNGINYTYSAAGTQTIDDGLQAGGVGSSPFNNVGPAWTLGTTPTDDGAAHIGRGFAPLGINQTLKVVFDNPGVAQAFFKGYFIRLNAGSGGTNGNICNMGYGCSHPNFPDGYPEPGTELRIFEYTPPLGQWQITDGAGTAETAVPSADTAAAGAVFKVTRTGATSYDWSLDSLGPGADNFGSSTFDSNLPVDWIEFVFFPSVLSDPAAATDFYVSNMMIVPEPGTVSLLVLGAGTLLGVAGARRRKQ